MAQFSYKARRRTGEVVQGVLDVSDRAAALSQVEKMGLFPVSIEAQGGKGGKGGKKGGGFSFNKNRKPKLQEIATFTRQLANLLRSGMPLTVALNSMTHLESKGIPSDVSRMLQQEVMEGRSLSASMGKQPHIFSHMYVNMVQAGEQSGALEDVLRRLADHFERFAEVQSRFKSAMIYPALVMCVGILIIIVFMKFMMPKFMLMFQGLNVELPAATQFLMDFTEKFNQYWWVMVGVAFCSGLIFVRFKATPRGKRLLAQWSMKAPIVGKVVCLNLYGQFARTLGTLLRNGVPVLNALKITEQVISNVILKEAIAKTREDVTDGKTIAQPLARSGVFPQLMIDLPKIGEDTGDVPGSLENLAETYEGELSTSLRVLTTLIEPVLLIVIAGMVGFIAYSILTAMMAITRSMQT